MLVSGIPRRLVSLIEMVKVFWFWLTPLYPAYVKVFSGDMLLSLSGSFQVGEIIREQVRTDSAAVGDSANRINNRLSRICIHR